MKTRIIRIGNSRGVRIPKVLLEESGLDGDVELRASEGKILIERPPEARAGWSEAARLVRERGEDGLIDEPTPTEFDDNEWAWE
ncbi:MAG: AbrB/MazE/SpoVT family DNA-binding domain-containing protein [Gemmatimonadota bacterium]|nr:AbrB/MazE/SpoVT family DNA-binding domain-containing protein [Gemmatimonadota bacterium]